MRVESGFATNGYGDRSPGGYGLLAWLIIEVVLTAVFVYIILGATDDRAPKGFAPDRHRPGLDDDPPRRHSGDELLGQPGTLARRGLVRGRCALGPRCGCSSSRRSSVQRSPVPRTRSSPELRAPMSASPKIPSWSRISRLPDSSG